MRSDDCHAVLTLLNEAFGRQKPWSWFDWKHRRGPWGASTGWLATQGDRVAGARLFLPWAVWGFEGSTSVPVGRAVDGAVAPWARRQGLFSKSVVAEMEAMSGGDSNSRLLYSTSVPASREAYRKLGWTIWNEEHHLRPARGAVKPPRFSWRDSGSGFEEAADCGVVEGRTAWSPDALQWRFSPQSGHTYRTAVLRESDSRHGLVARRSKIKGIPTLVAVHSWGSPKEVDVLVDAAAVASRCPLVLEVGGSRKRWNSVKVGESTISAWTMPDALGKGARLMRRLHFDFADLEGVM